MPVYHPLPDYWQKHVRKRKFLGQESSFLRLVCLSSAVMFLSVWNVGAIARLIPDFSTQLPAAADDTESASFGLCAWGGRRNCVIDGDTFIYQGQKIRVANIDAPETHPARCESEAEKGKAATMRLLGLLNEGSFRLASIDRDRDVYGRLLRIPYRDGESLGAILVEEGLARPYGNGRQPWC